MAISIIRTIILFTALMFSMRIMGKRQLGELEPSELVVAVLISNLASHPLQDVGTPLLYGLIPVLTLLCCEVIISGITVKSLGFRQFICGKPNMIIEHGKIVQREMKKNRITLDELYEELRKNGISDISIIKYAILETDGKLSFLLYSAEAPVTPKQLNLSPPDQEYPIIVINDGRTLSKNLSVLGHSENWLNKELKKHGVKNARDVYLMTADKNGQIYYSLKEVK